MQTAAKCAERQGVSAFESFHQRLFMAHFHDNLDISRQAMLWRLARDSRLDVPRFQQDYTDGEAYQAVLHDYAEGVAHLTPARTLPPRGGAGWGADDVLLT